MKVPTILLYFSPLCTQLFLYYWILRGRETARGGEEERKEGRDCVPINLALVPIYYSRVSVTNLNSHFVWAVI